MDVDTSSIESLPQPLQDVFGYLQANYDDDDIVQFAYGAEDVLVVISESEEAAPTFQQAVASAILDGTETQCGFVLDDGPEGYEEYTTAFVRAAPVNAYEYVLPYCAAVEADAGEAARVFGTVYSKADGEEGADDAPKIAAAHIYLLLPNYGSGGYIEELAELAGTTPDKLRRAVADVQSEL